MSAARAGAIVLRILLGGLFIYASQSKILDPAGFSRTVYHYKLLPVGAVNLVAITLPWVELLTGVLLVTGIRVRGAALVAALSLAGFLIGLTSAFARGLNIACGCFSATGGRVNLEHILGDIALLAVAAFIYRVAASVPAAALPATQLKEKS